MRFLTPGVHPTFFSLTRKDILLNVSNGRCYKYNEQATHTCIQIRWRHHHAKAISKLKIALLLNQLVKLKSAFTVVFLAMKFSKLDPTWTCSDEYF